MKIVKFLNAIDGHICGGDQYQWKCYGNNARFMNVADIDNNEIGGCVFDTKTSTVYEVEVYITEDNVAYRWIDPEYLSAYQMEATDRKIEWKIAYDDVAYIEADEISILDLIHRVIHKTYVHSQVDVTATDVDSGDFTFEGESTEPNIEVENKIEYEVKINVTHCLSVEASNMEEAASISKDFVLAMKPELGWPEKLSWIDSYASKEEVSRNLVVEHIKE